MMAMLALRLRKVEEPDDCQGLCLERAQPEAGRAGEGHSAVGSLHAATVIRGSTERKLLRAPAAPAAAAYELLR